MARYSPSQADMLYQVQGQVDPYLDITDTMSAAAQDALRAGPSSSILREVKSWLDDSDAIDPLEANRLYGLDGEAAFKPEDKVTVDQAKAVSDDYHKTRLNDFIKAKVAEDSPVMGKVAEIAGSLGAGFVDPAMIAANVLGVGIASKAIGAVASSHKVLGAVSKVSPVIGKAFVKMYADDAAKGVGTIIAREGLENFAGSVLEETVNFAGVGQDRLARDITAQESLMNIFAGTVLGTGLAIPISKEGRRALANTFKRKHGDNAAAYLDASIKTTTAEATVGAQKSMFTEMMANKEHFSAKPWHPEVYQYAKVDNLNEKRFFLPIKEDGTVHMVADKGRGTAFTDNINHAMNNGKSIIEFDHNVAKILLEKDIVQDGAHTPVGQSFKQTLIEEISMADSAKVRDFASSLADTDVKTDAQAIEIISNLLDGKTIDGMLDVVDEIRADINTRQILDSTLEANGYDGYHFTGKDYMGNDAYNGLYVTEKAGTKLSKKKVIESAAPSEGDKVRYQVEQEQMVKNYHEQMSKGVESPWWENPEGKGIVPERDVEKVGEQKNDMDFILDEQDRAIYDELKAEAEAKAAASPENMDIKKNAQLLQEIVDGKRNRADLEDAEYRGIVDYMNCKRTK